MKKGKRIQICVGCFQKSGSQIYINPEGISKKDLEWIKKKNQDSDIEKIKARD